MHPGHEMPCARATVRRALAPRRAARMLVRNGTAPLEVSCSTVRQGKTAGREGRGRAPRRRLRSRFLHYQNRHARLRPDALQQPEIATTADGNTVRKMHHGLTKHYAPDSVAPSPKRRARPRGPVRLPLNSSPLPARVSTGKQQFRQRSHQRMKKQTCRTHRKLDSRSIRLRIEQQD